MFAFHCKVSGRYTFRYCHCLSVNLNAVKAVKCIIKQCGTVCTVDTKICITHSYCNIGSSISFCNHSKTVLCLCGKSGLFLVVDENPYKEECYVRVYKILPEGRLAEVAALNRGGGDYFEVDLDDFVWVGESSFIANKKTSEDELQCDFYGGCSDSCLEEYRKCGYLQIDEDGWGYVRVDLRPDALQTKQELPSSLEAINEMNAWVKSL